MLSLATNPAALLMDDEMNVLPTSSHVRSIKALPRDEDGAVLLPGPSAVPPPLSWLTLWPAWQTPRCRPSPTLAPSLRSRG